MNETILLSSEYISKEMLKKEIIIKDYHFEEVNDDELWLIYDKYQKCAIKISLVNIVNGIYKYSDNPVELLDDLVIPIKGVFYFVEYNDSKVMNIVSKMLLNDKRHIFVLNKKGSRFIEIK